MIGDTIDLLVYLMKNSFHTRNCELSQFLCLPSYLFIYRFCIFYFVSSLQEIAFNCTLFSVSPILEYPMFDLSFTCLKVPYNYPFSLSHDTVTLTPIVVTHSTFKLTSLYEIFWIFLHYSHGTFSASDTILDINFCHFPKIRVLRKYSV